VPTRVYGPRSFSDDTVRHATGKTWPQWYAVLDQCGVESRGHTATAKYLREAFKLSPWWSQAVTARYEWERGLKKDSDKK
jgi:hypothetical protein